VSAGIGEGDGERPEPRADLDDERSRGGAGVGRDRARQVRIDEEVLAERLGRPDLEPFGERADLLKPEDALPRGAGGTSARTGATR